MIINNLKEKILLNITSRIFIIFIIITIFFPHIIYASVALEPIKINSHVREISLVPYAQILEDKDGKWTLKDVMSKEISQLFIHSNSKSLNYGYTSSVYWVRFKVLNKTDAERNWLLEISYSLLDRIHIFIINKNGGIAGERISGDIFPFYTREVKHRNFIFKLKEKPGDENTYYVRFQTKGTMLLKLTMWDPDEFINASNYIQIFLGIYYGSMLVMLLYNLFIFVSTKDRGYLYYIVYCLSFILFQLSMDGLAFQYLWPNSVWWVNNSIPLFILLMLILAIQFSRKFLDIEKHIPVIDILLKVILFLCIGFLPFSITVDYVFMLYVSISLAILLALLLAGVSIKLLISGYRHALFYVIAWTAFWIGTVLYSFKHFSILPDNIITDLLLQTASLMQVVLLSFGLADRINFMKKELQKLNTNLEGLVADRTRELDLALTDMKKKDKIIQIEFELAGNIQQGILPETPFYFEGIKIDAYYKAMGKVGGDFYDIFHMKGGYLGVLIADASGHGMPAAFLTALAKISFSEAIQKHLFPTDIFKHVNDELVETIKTDDFVTAFFLVISPTYEIFFCNASHQMALLLRKETLTISELDTDGLFMGALPIANEMYKDGQDKLGYGDRVVLFTDGIAEAQNVDKEVYGSTRLKELLIATASLSYKDAIKKLVSDWEEFTAGSKQNDDATMVLIEIDPIYKDLNEYRDRGFKFLSEKKFTDAIQELKRALALNAMDEKSQLYIGECYLKIGDYSNAVLYLEKYLKNNDVDANVWYHISVSYFNLNDFDMAYNTALKASQLRNNFIDALIICGLSLKEFGMLEDATNIWKRILQIDRKNEIAQKELLLANDLK